MINVELQRNKKKYICLFYDSLLFLTLLKTFSRYNETPNKKNHRSQKKLQPPPPLSDMNSPGNV